MKRLIFVIVFVVVVPSLAIAQDPVVGFYFYNVFESKPLPVGTPVWANLGDGKCAHGDTFPSAADACFEPQRAFRPGFGEYYKGRIKQIVRVCMDYPVENPRPCSEWWWAYRIEFEFLFRGQHGGVVSQWNGGFDDAFTAYNLPEKWAKHSKYFIRLGW